MSTQHSGRSPRSSQARMPLIGLARPLRMALSGIDLAPLRSELLERIANNPFDAYALLDLSVVLQLEFKREVALRIQQRALEIRQLYHLSSPVGRESLKLLVIATPGDFMMNTPVELLLEDSDVQIEMLYVGPTLALPSRLPVHDVVFVAIGEPDLNNAALGRTGMVVKSSMQPILNQPQSIMHLTRDRVSELLRQLPGVIMPRSVRVDRLTLDSLARSRTSLDQLLPEGRYPVLARPIGSHAGNGLVLLRSPDCARMFLATTDGDAFYVTQYVDFRKPDGLYRKYRIVVIDGRMYICHLAISDQWMVHYVSAGMAQSPEKRAEEAQFMRTFDEGFALRHDQALRLMCERIELDYFIIDCGETADGQLLIFEIDTGAIIHSMDPVDLFPYKKAQMSKVFHAFRAMLTRALAADLRGTR